eukprot:10724939-Lingulodinium_polyedra.AAC.1
MVPGGHGGMGALRRPRTLRECPQVPEPTGRAAAESAPSNLLLVPRCPSGDDLAMAGSSVPYRRT